MENEKHPYLKEKSTTPYMAENTPFLVVMWRVTPPPPQPWTQLHEMVLAI